jgi:hypothetical protein
MQVNVINMLAAIPNHMLAILCSLQSDSGWVPVHGDPSTEKSAKRKSDALENLTDLRIKSVPFDAHLLQCVELANIFCTALHTGPEHSSPAIATYNWPAIQANALRIRPRVLRPSPVLSDYLHLLDVHLCKLLSLERPTLEAAFLASERSQVQWYAYDVPLLLM